jgi:hypothetical protein
LRLARGRLLQWRDFDQGLARFGDDERFTLGRALDQSRQMRLGLVNVEGFHPRPQGVN